MREANEAPRLKGEFPKQQEILKEHQSSPREHTNRAAAAWARPDADGWTESKTKGGGGGRLKEKREKISKRSNDPWPFWCNSLAKTTRTGSTCIIKCLSCASRRWGCLGVNRTPFLPFPALSKSPQLSSALAGLRHTGLVTRPQEQETRLQREKRVTPAASFQFNQTRPSNPEDLIWQYITSGYLCTVPKAPVYNKTR